MRANSGKQQIQENKGTHNYGERNDMSIPNQGQQAHLRLGVTDEKQNNTIGKASPSLQECSRARRQPQGVTI
jgi:hypothetical protein